MPTNKNASIRYQALDKCFRDRCHRYYIDDLIEKCEDALYYYNGIGAVSRRQVFEDIKFMESDAGWDIPLERKRDGKKIYYRYSDTDFSINQQPLTDEEARQFRAAIVTLGRFRGLPSNEWVEEVISTLEWRFNLKGSSANVIGFEQNPQLKGLSFLAPIIDAALNHQVLYVAYRSYQHRDTLKEAVVHPRYVKQYNKRWFFLAEDDHWHTITIFALDRIEEIHVVEDIPFRKDDTTDFSHFFDDVIGVTIPKAEMEKQTIVLRFTPKQFPYVVSKPLHHSQTIISEDERLLSIEVRPTYELDQQILSFGNDVEVLKPASYRTHIIEKLTESLKKYGSVQIGCTDAP